MRIFPAQPPRNHPSKQQGVMLLEALIAIVIFSLGVLALVGLQAATISFSTDARSRAEASFLANELIGQIWVDRTNKINYNYPGGSAAPLATWVTKVQGALPGSVANPPTVSVVVAGGVAAVTVTLRWQVPNSTTVHNYLAIAQVSDP